METTMKRKLKIYYENYTYRVEGLRPMVKEGQCPMIRISGKYLMKFGFNTGDSIELDFETDHIAIKKIPKVYEITNEDEKELTEKIEKYRAEEIEKIRERNAGKEQERGIEI